MVEIRRKKAQCVSNRCKDLFKRKKNLGFRCTLSKRSPNFMTTKLTFPNLLHGSADFLSLFSVMNYQKNLILAVAFNVCCLFPGLGF